MGPGFANRGRLIEKFGEFRRHIHQPAPDEPGVAAMAKQLRRGAIGRRDPPIAIEANDAGADAAQHRLDEPAARFGFFLCGHQFTPLGFELRRHAVECCGERIDLVALLIDGNARLQISGSDPPRCVGEAPDRFSDARGAR